MARKGGARDLYLQVSAGVDFSALKAGRSVLNEFGTAAIDVAAEVDKALGNIGFGKPADQARAMERELNRTFDRIRDSSRKVLDAPSGAAAVGILDANAARQAAEAAEDRAAALRLVADAATRADAAAAGSNEKVRTLAIGTEVAARAAEEHARALRDEAAVLELVQGELVQTNRAAADHVAGGRNVTAVTGQQRAGMQQLSYQIGDVATQFASGTSASIIFAQQSGQVIQALSLMTNGTKGLLGFLGGPWGIAFSSALVVATPLVAKLFEESEASKEATKAAKEHKRAVLDLADAQDDAIRTADEKLARDAASIRSDLDAAIATRKRTQAVLELAKANLDAAKKRSDDPTLAGEGGFNGGAAAAASYDSQISALTKALATNEAEIRRLTGGFESGLARLIESKVDARSTPEGLLQARYEREVSKVQNDPRYRGEANAGRLAARLRRLAEINEEEREKLRQGKKKPREVSLGDQVDTARGGELLGTAERYRGQREGAGTLTALFKQANVKVDPKITAWCAAFVNAVLATNGLPGTGSLAARSFLGYGSSTDKPVKGDIVVSRRGGPATGHVGFYQGTDAAGNVLVLGGNTSDKVGTQKVARRDILGIRRAPSAADIYKDEQEDQLTVDDVFDAEGFERVLREVDERRRQAVAEVFGTADPLEKLISDAHDQVRASHDIDLDARAKAAEEPIAQLREQLEKSVGDTGHALDDVGARGLDALSDGLADIITGTESVGSAFKRMAASIIADLARVAAQKLILSILTGGSGGFLSSLFGRAGGGKVERRAGGGKISGPGTGTSDSILALIDGQQPLLVSNGESIVTAEATRRYWPLIDAMNKGRIPGRARGGPIGDEQLFLPALPTARSLASPAAGGGQPMVFDLRGALVTADLLAQINQTMARHAQVSVIAGSRMAQDEWAESQMQVIPQ